MPTFSILSEQHMKGCHPDLQRLWQEIIKHVDCSILNGGRTVEQQKENIRQGLSKTMNSMHLLQSDGYFHANDVAPWPQKWNDPTPADMTQWEVDQVYFAGFVKGVAVMMGIDIRTGADWNGDGRNIGQGFRDLDHFELPVQELHGS